MSTVYHVGDFRSELEQVRSQLRKNHLNAVRDLLTDKIIYRACAEVGLLKLAPFSCVPIYIRVSAAQYGRRNCPRRICSVPTSGRECHQRPALVR